MQRMDPATRGMIYHEAQAELLAGRRTGRSGWTTVLDAVAAKYEEKLAPAIPQIWRAEVRGDSRGFARMGAAEAAAGAGVVAGGVRAGVRSRAGRGYRLKGRIDLIERHASGMLRVVDHKTGKPREPRPEMVGGGEALQPALYALAAEAELGERCRWAGCGTPPSRGITR